MKNFKPTQYTLSCVKTARKFEDAGWTLDDVECATPSLIRAEYQNKQLEVGDESMGLYKFADWLPISRVLEGSSAPVTYKSEGLAKCLGLENLYITMSGYFPQRGATFQTCSFKETEAYTVCGRMKENNEKVLVVSSAGNTARAFAKVCSDNNIKLLLTVPQDNIDALWFSHPIKDCVKLITVEEGADYFDAISLGNAATKCDKFFPEGGAKNVARRDGMATTFLSATTFIGQMPDYYFQAVGSGTGAIAAWEANLRFIEDGRFGTTKTKLMLSQNAPFLPMYDAWMQRSPKLLPFDDDEARRQVEIIDAKVLSNRQPPYAVCGGLFDALADSDGVIYAVENEEAREAAKLFKEVEGVDLLSASAVAVASLINSVKNGDIDTSKIVMVNITGAGQELFASEHELHYLKPEKVFKVGFNPDEVVEYVSTLF